MKCKIAVVGTGSIGMRHLTLLQQMDGVEPMVIPKRKEKQAELRSQGFQVSSSLKEAAKEGARLAIIASNTAQHRGDALEALEQGMDLLVEKPLSVDAAQAMDIYRAAQKKNRQLFVGCVLRCSKSLQTFREWLPKTGRVYAVRIECQAFLANWRPRHPYRQSYSARGAEGGVLRDLIHEIDYAAWLFGWPQSVQARLKNTGLLEIEAEEFAELWWETKEGISVSICLDYLSRVPRRYLMAFGEKGNLEWDGVIRKTRLETPDGFEETDPEPDRSAIYLTQLKEWLKVCSASDQKSLLASGLDGVRALAICDAAREASQGRKETAVVYNV